MITNGLKQRLTLSREAEQSVLGGLMLSNHFWKEIKALLSTEDFVLPEHRILFANFEKLDTQGQPFDPVTCSYHLEQQGMLATIGGNSYLRLLMEHTPSTANLIAYAQIIKECALSDINPSGDILNRSVLKTLFNKQLLSCTQDGVTRCFFLLLAQL